MTAAPTAAALTFIGKELVVATAILLPALVLQCFIKQLPAARHAVLMGALVTVGLSPFVVSVGHTVGLRSTSFGGRLLLNRLASLAQSTPTLQSKEKTLSSKRLPVAPVLLGIWALGAFVILAHLVRGLRVMNHVRSSAKTDARIVPLLDRLESVLGDNAPNIYVCERVGIPLATGFWRPVILLPSSFLTRFDDDQLLQMLVHECAHAHRRDTIAGVYQRLLAGLLWFHPFVHITNRLLDRAREEVCDNYVLQTVGPVEYSRTLLKVAQSLMFMPTVTVWFAATFARTAPLLEDRVAGLLNPRRNTMTRLTLRQNAAILTAFVVGAFVVSSFAAGSKNDEEAIRATVTDYIEGYYSGDANRMERSVHPHYLKHTISGSGDELKMSEHTGLEMIENVRAHGPSELPASERKEQITVLDVAGDVASAKLVTTHWVDYVTLSKWHGEWKIVSVVLREID